MCQLKNGCRAETFNCRCRLGNWKRILSGVGWVERNWEDRCATPNTRLFNISSPQSRTQRNPTSERKAFRKAERRWVSLGLWWICRSLKQFRFSLIWVLLVVSVQPNLRCDGTVFSPGSGGENLIEKWTIECLWVVGQGHSIVPIHFIYVNFFACRSECFCLGVFCRSRFFPNNIHLCKAKPRSKSYNWMSLGCRVCKYFGAEVSKVNFLWQRPLFSPVEFLCEMLRKLYR